MAKTTRKKTPVTPYGQEDLARRIMQLAGRCMVFLSEMNARYRANFEFDPVILIAVVQSAMEDIYRYKVYHLNNDGAKLSDAIKRAAYFTKWIVRFRPIYHAGRTPAIEDFRTAYSNDDIALLINEAFALDWAFTTIGTEVGTSKLFPAPEILADLLYDLHYRAMSEDALMEIFSIFRMHAKGQKIIVT
jgi:hypothetical protein